MLAQVANSRAHLDISVVLLRSCRSLHVPAAFVLLLLPDVRINLRRHGGWLSVMLPRSVAGRKLEVEVHGFRSGSKFRVDGPSVVDSWRIAPLRIWLANQRRRRSQD